MSDQEKFLWDLVDKLVVKDFFKKENIESTLGLSLEKDPSSNEYFTFFEARNIVVKGGVPVSRVLLGVSSANASKNMLTIEIRDFCIDKDSVIEKFGHLSILGAPRGRSLDEQTVYGLDVDGKHLVFGFSERNPKCLSSIGMKLESGSK